MNEHEWGVFYDGDGEDDWHVAPCTREGELLAPHRLSASCLCRPRLDVTGRGYIHDSPKHEEIH